MEYEIVTLKEKIAVGVSARTNNTSPDMGAVIGDVTARRGNILGQIPRSGSTQIDANVPLSEMFGYATDLRSKTQGRGQYSMEPSHYTELPKSKSEEIIAKRARG